MNMIHVLDSNRNVGIISMLSGFFLIVTGIVGFFTAKPDQSITTCVSNIIMGEVLFLVGFGLYRKKPYAHFFRLFDDHESRIGILCSISAGFGLSYLIGGVFSIAIKDSPNAIGNILSGLSMLICPGLIINFKGKTAARVAHSLMGIFATLTFIAAGLVAFVYAGNADIPSIAECVFHTILLFVMLVYLLDRAVEEEIWGGKMNRFACTIDMGHETN